MNKCPEIIQIFESRQLTLLPYEQGKSDREAYLRKQQDLSEPPPSEQAVRDLYAAKPNAISKVAETFFGRALIIGTAITVFGDRRSVVRNSLVASASIEAFLLWWHKLRAR